MRAPEPKGTVIYLRWSNEPATAAQDPGPSLLVLHRALSPSSHTVCSHVATPRSQKSDWVRAGTKPTTKQPLKLRPALETDETDVIPVCKPLQYKTTTQQQQLNLYSLNKHTEHRVWDQTLCSLGVSGRHPRDIPSRCSTGSLVYRLKFRREK